MATYLADSVVSCLSLRVLRALRVSPLPSKIQNPTLNIKHPLPPIFPRSSRQFSRRGDPWRTHLDLSLAAADGFI